MTAENDRDGFLLNEAIRQSARCLTEPGLGPFGAVIARDGEIVAVGANLASIDLDPSAHAEIVAIRNACRTLGTTDLSDCVLYVSGIPCPMCGTAAHFAGIRTIHVASGNPELADAFATIGRNLWGEYAELLAVATGNWAAAGWTVVEHRAEKEKAVQVLNQWAAMVSGGTSPGKEAI